VISTLGWHTSKEGQQVGYIDLHSFRENEKDLIYCIGTYKESKHNLKQKIQNILARSL
jgi:hypothetical protein